MGWQTAAALNGLIAICYVLIAGVISVGLIRTKQLTTNPLAIATATIFYTCAIHHGHHALHLVAAFGAQETPEQLAAVRAVFGTWHTITIDLVGAAVAVTYLGLRRNYKALLNTPQMFDDSVRLAAERALRELAFTDLLTGIPNRAAYQALADGLAGDQRPVAVLFLDLDGFKGVNDRFGHDVGDRVLRDVAQSLVAAAGDDEHVFRLGGDELIVVGLGQDVAAARALTDRMEAAVRQPIVTREVELTITASCGVATGTASKIDGLLRSADHDMYRIKSARRLQSLPGPRPGATLRLDEAAAAAGPAAGRPAAH